MSYEFEVDFYGFKYPGNLNSFLDWSVYFYGAYSKHELFLLKDLICELDKDSIFVDVGANVGNHALYMSRFAEKVYAFEPYEVVRSKLEEKILINNIKNIEVIPVGLGIEDSEMDYFAPVSHNLGTGSFMTSHAEGSNSYYGKLKLVKGDNYFIKNIPRVNLMKIDVEGFESYVLLGLKNNLYINRPIIYMEFSDTTRRSFKSFDELKKCIPDNYNIIGVTFGRGLLTHLGKPYILSEFKFDKPTENILFLPTELYSVIYNKLCC